MDKWNLGQTAEPAGDEEFALIPAESGIEVFLPRDVRRQVKDAIESGEYEDELT